MSIKKPAVTTQLKTAKAEVADLTAKVATLEKEKASAKSSVEYHSGRAQKAEAEIEQLHQFFDSIQLSIPRKIQHENGYSSIENSAMTRLCAWLANK